MKRLLRGVRRGMRHASPAVLLLPCSLLLIAAALLLAGCQEKVRPGSAEVKRQVVSGVVVQEAKPSPVKEYYATSATVKAKTTSVIASRVMGTVTSMKVREGDRVGTGQILMAIDDRDTAEKVAESEAGYRESLMALEAAKENKSLADVTYQRYRNLVDERVITQQELDQIETQKKVADIEYERVREVVTRAKAGLSEAQILYGFTKVAAPISGIVTEKKIETGSMAVPGVPVMTVEDVSSFRLDAYVDEGLAGKLRTGMPVGVVIDSIGKDLKGKISEIVPAVDPLSRTFLIKVAVPGQGLRSGLYAKVRIPFGRKEALVIPETAIVEKGQLTGVYAVDERGVISYRLIRTGRRYDHGVEILSGINPGERIITEGADRAVDGGILGQVSGKQEASAPARQR
jgi:RND family efflux transporter MFP subunit